MWNNKQRQEVRHMTDAEYRITMYALKGDVLLKERTYEGNAQCALAIMGAWIQDAQTVANVLDCTMYVVLEGTGNVIVSASAYIDPIRGQ